MHRKGDVKEPMRECGKEPVKEYRKAPVKEIRIISFTEAGAGLAASLAAGLKASVQVQAGVAKKSLSDWTGAAFQEADALVFIGACGIAVRSIAPFIRSKAEDPAVVVLDEKGQFVIPLLSGHLGGANELALQIAALTGGQPVLTTATDVNGLFAVDVFAKKNKLLIADLKRAKEVSAALLREGRAQLLFCEDVTVLNGIVPEELEVKRFIWSKETDVHFGAVPEGVDVYQRTEPHRQVGKQPTARILVSPATLTQACSEHTALLQLIPKCFVVGMGCRRGKTFTELSAFLEQVLEEQQILPESILALTSIDLKKDEAGLVELAEALQVPFLTFSEEQLNQAEGIFTASAFVKEKTGVDNVCERSVIAAGAERIHVKKISRDGMTLALGIRRQSLSF